MLSPLQQRRNRWSPRPGAEEVVGGPATQNPSRDSEVSPPSFGAPAGGSDTTLGEPVEHPGGGSTTSLELTFGRGSKASGFAAALAAAVEEPASPREQPAEPAGLDLTFGRRGGGGAGCPIGSAGTAQTTSTRSASPTSQSTSCTGGHLAYEANFGRVGTVQQGGFAWKVLQDNNHFEGGSFTGGVNISNPPVNPRLKCAATENFDQSSPGYVPVVKGKLVGDPLPTSLAQNFTAEFGGDDAKANRPPALALPGPRRPAVVRLPRAHEWLGCSIGATSGSLKPLPEWAAADRQLHSQRVLGASRADAVALIRWYAPYAVFCGSYALILHLAGGSAEFAIFSMPLLVALLVWHLSRLLYWDWALLAVVDGCAADEVRKQLSAPWGEGTAFFSANLGAVLSSMRTAPHALLLSRPTRPSHRRTVVFVVLLITVLGFLRLVRWGMGGVTGWLFAEVIASAVAVVSFIFIGCAHSQARSRAAEADLRLEALEAAFNTMLDVLRPLLGGGAGNMEAVDAAHSGSTASKLALNGFCVRLVTGERKTLRAALSFGLGGTPALHATCPLAGFSVAASMAESATPGDLGGGGGRGGGGGIASETAPLRRATNGNMVSWAAGALFGRLGHEKLQDVARSISISSTSTANTLGQRVGDQLDEQAVVMAVGMVTTVCARRGHPLEAFRSTALGGSGVVPPKAALDEPCLVLSLDSEKMRVSEEGATPLRLPCLRSPKGQQLRADVSGVLRDGTQLQRLFKPPSADTGGHFDCNADTPRSWAAASCGTGATATPSEWEDSPPIPSFGPSSGDGDNGKKFNLSAAEPEPTGSTLRHLVLLFDNYAERDQCLCMLRSYHFLPEGASSEVV